MKKTAISPETFAERPEYLPPSIEIIAVESEGVIASSVEDMIDGGRIGG